LDFGETLLRRERLNLGPPLAECGVGIARRHAQQQKIVGAAKTRVIQKTQRTAPLAALEARLERDDLAQRQRESARNRDARLLPRDHDFAGREKLLDLRA